ncbi:MAG: GerMN domain-containing protein [Lachnospiraceae bacterium]|nr:GerMN domain-containing protein [Lachnospiraceae bacterium]
MKPEIKKLLFVLSVALMLAGLVSCAKKSESKNGKLSMYVIDKNSFSVEQVAYSAKGSSPLDKIKNLLADLQAYRDDTFSSPVPESITLKNWELSSGIVSLYFDESYYNLTVYDEALVRAALVRNFCQFAEISGVNIFIGEQALVIDGKATGTMTNDSFLDKLSFTEGTTELILYFPSDASGKLKKIKREAALGSFYTDEQLIIENLIKGPHSSEKDIVPCIPKGTRLLNVVTKDRVCYVNLSREFLNLSDDKSPELTVYSIVNSLTELPEISSVVLNVNWENIEFYGDVYCIDNLTFNYDALENSDNL